MMKSSDSKVAKVLLLLLVVIITSVMAAPAFCRTNNTAVLLLQQTPKDGGIVTPDVGVYRFGVDKEVAISAIARSGYQFVYWLGDVEDPTSPTTYASIDSPKIIVAVFERVEYDLLRRHENEDWQPSGSLRRSAVDYSRNRSNSPRPRRERRIRYREPYEPPRINDPFPVPDDHDDVFPVPGGSSDDDFPVPIPEPTTTAILVIGSLLMSRFSRKRHHRG